MRTSGLLTIVLVMPRSSRAADFVAVSTIRSIFSARFLAAPEESAAESSKRFSAAWPGKAKIDNGARICVTICQSRSKKRRLVRKRKSKFENWTLATNAAEMARNRDHARSIVQCAEVAAR